MENLNIWSDIGDAQILHGDCIEKMKTLKENSIDAIITDPPYGIGFMGKKWDQSVPALAWAQECLRVLKPGGHIVAFASTRTYHRLAVNLEDAGFQIRDMITWCYVSGFPKNLNISKQIDKAVGAERKVVGKAESWNRPNSKAGDTARMNASPAIYNITKPATKDAERFEGYGTALKPAQEPGCLARKPIEKGLTVAQNVLKWGTGAININDCRFGFEDPCWIGSQSDNLNGGTYSQNASVLNRQSQVPKNGIGEYIAPSGRWPANIYQCSKPSRTEREQGLSHLSKQLAKNNVTSHNGTGDIRGIDKKPLAHVSNFHPTVKPIKLFRWLCRLLGGEKGNVILDPFLGSGTTAVSAILEGYDIIGCERESDYLPIIRGRIDWAVREYKRENAQLSLLEVMK